MNKSTITQRLSSAQSAYKVYYKLSTEAIFKYVRDDGYKEEVSMGDKGKKDKDKGQKQKAKKQEQKSKKKQEKRPGSTQ